MNTFTQVASSLALSLAAVGLTVGQAYAGDNATRRYAEQECNSRIQRGFVANNQGAFNACVRQQAAFISPIINTPGYQGFCAGVEEAIQEDAEVRNNPAMAAQVRLMSGC